MYASLYVGLSKEKCWRRYSHSFPERCDGHTPVAWKGISMQAFRDDQGNLAPLFSRECIWGTF
jgi:hypothetical protein